MLGRGGIFLQKRGFHILIAHNCGASIRDSGLLPTVCPLLNNFCQRGWIWNVTFGVRICQYTDDRTMTSQVNNANLAGRKLHRYQGRDHVT
jgi:hypothetical protein